MKKYILKTQCGYTLIETIIALALILTALVGPISLVIRGIGSAPYSTNRLIAVTLAQEGIELVRAVRENNQICLAKVKAPPWSARHDWDTDYTGADKPADIEGIGRTADAINTTRYTCGTLTITNPTFGGNCDMGGGNPLKIDGNGNYQYVTGNPTIFYRCIDIARPSGSEASPNGLISAQNMMDITSTVKWSEKGTAKTITLTERLYNWK